MSSHLDQPDRQRPGNSLWVRRLGGRWPGSCEVCRAWSTRSFCASCMAMFGGERSRCPRCAEPVEAHREASCAATCPGCRSQDLSFVRARVAFDYAFPWDTLIQQLKFTGRTELARPLGEALAAHIQHSSIDSPRQPAQAPVDVILPMPLSNARLAERGYNQALLLARHVARSLGLPLDPDALLRPIDALHQADLPREQRMRNLRGVFMVDPAARQRLQGRRLALLDDVITTGSTANEASRELLRAGAREVEIWAVARTAAH